MKATESKIISDYVSLMVQKKGYDPLMHSKANLSPEHYAKCFSDLQHLFDSHLRKVEGSLNQFNTKLQIMKRNAENPASDFIKKTKKKVKIINNYLMPFEVENGPESRQVNVEKFEKLKKKNTDGSILSHGKSNYHPHLKRVKSSENILNKKYTVKKGMRKIAFAENRQPIFDKKRSSAEPFLQKPNANVKILNSPTGLQDEKGTEMNENKNESFIESSRKDRDESNYNEHKIRNIISPPKQRPIEIKGGMSKSIESINFSPNQDVISHF
jgi:hypothetical protein